VGWQSSSAPRDTNEDLTENKEEGFTSQTSQSGPLPVNIIDHSLIDPAYARGANTPDVPTDHSIAGSLKTGVVNVPSPVYK